VVKEPLATQLDAQEPDASTVEAEPTDTEWESAEGEERRLAGAVRRGAVCRGEDEEVCAEDTNDYEKGHHDQDVDAAGDEVAESSQAHPQKARMRINGKISLNGKIQLNGKVLVQCEKLGPADPAEPAPRGVAVAELSEDEAHEPLPRAAVAELSADKDDAARAVPTPASASRSAPRYRMFSSSSEEEDDKDDDEESDDDSQGTSTSSERGEDSEEEAEVEDLKRTMLSRPASSETSRESRRTWRGRTEKEREGHMGGDTNGTRLRQPSFSWKRQERESRSTTSPEHWSPLPGLAYGGPCKAPAQGPLGVGGFSGLPRH